MNAFVRKLYYRGYKEQPDNFIKQWRRRRRGHETAAWYEVRTPDASEANAACPRCGGPAVRLFTTITLQVTSPGLGGDGRGGETGVGREA